MRRSLDFLSKNLGAFQVAQWSRVCLMMRETQETQIWSLGWKLLWGRKWQPASVFLLGESHGEEPDGLQSMWSWQGHKESDTTEHIHILVKFFTVRRWRPQGQASHPCLNRDQGQGADPWLRDASCYYLPNFYQRRNIFLITFLFLPYWPGLRLWPLTNGWGFSGLESLWWDLGRKRELRMATERLACWIQLCFHARLCWDSCLCWKCGHDTISPLSRNLQVVNSQRCERVFRQCCCRPFSSTISTPLPPPVSNSSCLFTRCQPPYASCCAVTTVFFKVLYFKIRNIFFLFFMYYLCESIINLWQYSTV